MRQPLFHQIDLGQFLNYCNSGQFTNDELDLIGLNLQRSEDAHAFCRNMGIMLEPSKAEFVAQALAHSGKGAK